MSPNQLKIQLPSLAFSLHCYAGMTRLTLTSLALTLSMSGCVFSSERDDDDDYTCAAAAPAPERNPQTGQCETRGYYPCEGDVLLPEAPKGPTQYLEPLEPWAACYGGCEGQDEGSCRNDASCQTAYLDQDYWGCWELNTQLVTIDGDCASLNAAACSTRNDCVPVYNQLEVVPDPNTDEWGNSTLFARCDAESGDQPPPLSCANVLCNVGTHCEERPEGPACVPNQQDPGSCYGDTFCDGLPPNCPDGTLPGIIDGCWSGYCIPQNACEPAPSCQSVANEATCINRQDCLPLYVACEPNENCQYKYWGCSDN